MPLDKVLTATEARQRAEAAHEAAIVAAHAEGHSLRDIADAAGLSPAGVLKIVRRNATYATPEHVRAVLGPAGLLPWLFRGKVWERNGSARIMLALHAPDTDEVLEPGPAATAATDRIVAALAKAAMTPLGGMVGEWTPVVHIPASAEN